MSDVQARYFPVSERPLKMVAGLSRFGSDFGQGARDLQFFQVDEERPRYLAAKRRVGSTRHVRGRHDAESSRALAHALAFMRETLAREAPEVLRDSDSDEEASDELEALARALQEDFCVFTAGQNGQGRAVLLDVRFPSGWRPERLADATFEAIHGPVPDFPGTLEASRSMVRAMIERGPFVRFVWTLSPDDLLDHHPDAEGKVAWEQTSRVFLRVERQVTVPLTDADASLFLIRTYLYDFSALTNEQRATTLAAVAVMPPKVRLYKNIPTLSVLESALARAKPLGG